MMMFKTLWRIGLVLLMSVAVFSFSAQSLKKMPRQVVRSELRVALPLFVQVFMAMGDRNMAANIASIRALVVDTRNVKPDEWPILAKVQGDVSWLNPGHEDNYYIAAAILPWFGEVDAAQKVLMRATKARRYDYQPPFFYAFNQLHFRGDVLGAVAALKEGAEHLPDGDNKLHMQNLAAIWMEKAQDLGLTIRYVEVLAAQAKRPDFKRYLEARAMRLRMLKQLRDAASEYRTRYGRPPAQLDDLLSSGVLKQAPQDPFGFGFAMTPQGEIVLLNSPMQKK